MTRRWSTRLGAVLLVGAAALTGCSEKQEASTSLPTATAEASEDALPPLGPESFPVPKQAREQTADGAVEFVRYYVALTGHLALQSEDPTPLLELSRDCRTCGQIADAFEADLGAGYSYRDYVYEFDEYGPALVDGDKAEMGFSYVQGPITAVDRSGQVVPTRSAPTPQELQSGASLVWDQTLQSWVITGLTVG
ncbi:DUF6318 family protein [Blastococcus sp. LR1]|uniref:DUF6318 family protein n=1 Tax=Blastococcus sp. LR1 TaxID=2877000 RepID=UPI001CCECED6|nr:DUF6318 family protein [Blastococcus sp. LR1]MCA0146187.1 hypothetical protein [Blastococcus sp. LR1]